MEKKLYDLKCNFAVNPQAIDTPIPLFSWKIDGAGAQEVFQESCRVRVSEDRGRLSVGDGAPGVEGGQGGGDLWDSGWMETGLTSGIEYGGKALGSRRTYYWSVEVRLQDGREVLRSGIESFGTALLRKEDFFAKWIGFLPALEGECLCIRRDVSMKGGIKKAAAYTCGLGFYEFYVNGEKCGQECLEPVISTYSKTVYYQYYDILPLLREGKNTLAAVVGTGWFDRQIFWAQIYLTYEDGHEEVLYTDWAQGWVGRPGAIRQSLFGGEVFDAREAAENWMLPEYDQEAHYERPEGFIQMGVKEAPGGIMRSEPLEPIRVISSWTPVKLSSGQTGDTQNQEERNRKAGNQSGQPDREEGPLGSAAIYDTGQNMSGWVHLRYRGERGSRITVQYAETLKENGTELERENLRFAKSRNVLICDGWEQEYRPRFTYHGFRYFEIRTEGRVEILDCRVEEVHSDIRETGSFVCSNELLNKFQSCVRWTELSNMCGIPTDCCQRDERMGWLNDITSRSVEAFYNFDVARFYRKFMDDIADTVDEKTGAYADTAPYFWGFSPADTVSNAFIWINLLLYQFYGDQASIKKHYRDMQGWIEYQRSTERENHLIVTSYYGDWASPVGQCGDGTDSNAQSSLTSGDMISMSHLCRSLRWMARAAEILGRGEDKVYYEREYERYRGYFNEIFYHEDTGLYENGTQTSLACALLFDLVEEKNVERVLDNLIKNIEENDYHVTTGNLGTRILFDTLIRCGHQDVAYRLLTQTTYPSFLYMIKCGATTMWERWEYDPGSTMNSRNHPMHASNGVYLYQLLGGIYPGQDTRGLREIEIRPYVPADMDFVKVSCETVNGTVGSEWRKEDGKVRYRISIPANMRARLRLGGENRKEEICREVTSGEYEFLIG